MAITASLVKELRERTGAGMMDCKQALTVTEGDIELAAEELRKKGLSAAAKKSGRIAAEGLIGVAFSGKTGSIVEINAETDFVARNDIFQGFVSEVSQLALTNAEGDMLSAIMKSGKTVETTITDNISTIGENQSFRRSTTLSVTNGVIVSYIHGALAEGLGKIGVLVALESDADTTKLEALGKQISMHIASAKPQFNTSDDVDPAVIEAERKFLTEQALEEGKPAEIVAKMIEGRLRKFKEEIVLADQTFVVDGETKISDVVANAAKELGTDVKIAGFVSYILGDGIEKKVENFAEEVAKTMGA